MIYSMESPSLARFILVKESDSEPMESEPVLRLVKTRLSESLAGGIRRISLQCRCLRREFSSSASTSDFDNLVFTAES